MPVSASRLGAALVIAVLLPALSTAVHADDLAPAARAAVAAMEQAASGRLDVRASRLGGVAAFVAGKGGRAVRLATPPGARAGERAREFVRRYGRAFGLETDADVEIVGVQEVDDVGMEHVRLRQMHRGLRVAGAEVLVHLRGTDVVAASARTVADADRPGAVPSISAAAALAASRVVLGDAATAASFTAPRLELFNRGLFDGRPAATRLSWFIEARAPLRREVVWVDAERGAILLHFNQIPDGLQRAVYDGMEDADLPGTLVRVEGGPPTGDPDADGAYDFTGDMYAYFLSEHGRDGYDGAGATMESTVHSCPSFCACPCDNAFWDGIGTVFGDGFVTDDIVAHEWTHAVTQYSADLFYFMQPGALNESYSDIFGETVDQLNGVGLDTPAAKWWFAEDRVGAPGGFRNLMDPTLRDDPGKLSDPEMVCNDGSIDSGGVHSNSGVPNHAYALMVGGGTYNGYAVTGIGLAKAARIQYRALTVYLSATATFRDNYDALQQACDDLIGTIGITGGDCVEVRKALDAVEMGAAWPCTVECAPAPSDTCRLPAEARRGSLALRANPSAEERVRLSWKWLRGEHTSSSDFGLPIVSTVFSLCLYAGPAQTLVAESVIPGNDTCAGEPCWRAIGGGYKYLDRLGLAGGIEKIKLKAGDDGRAKILFKAKGAAIPMPSLPLALPVTIQLDNNNGECWQATYSSASDNDPAGFKAKND